MAEMVYSLYFTPCYPAAPLRLKIETKWKKTYSIFPV